MSEADRNHLADAVEVLEADPFPDNVTKFESVIPPDTFLYQDDSISLTYQLCGDEVRVLGVNKTPALWRAPPGPPESRL